MALQSQVVDLPFGSAKLNESLDERVNQTGFRQLYNVDFQTPGLLSKRPGLSWLTQSGSALGTYLGRSRMTFHDETLLMPFTYHPSDTTSRRPQLAFYKDYVANNDVEANFMQGEQALSEFLVERRGVHNDSAVDLVYPCMCATPNFFIYVWQWQIIASGSEVHYKIVERATGHTVSRGSIAVAASTTTQPLVERTGDAAANLDIALIVFRSAANTLSSVLITCSADPPTIGATTTVTTDLKAGSKFGLAPIDGGAGWFLSFCKDATANVALCTLGGGTGTISATSNFAVTASSEANVASIGGNAYIVWNDDLGATDSIRYAVQTSGLVAVLAATNMITGLTDWTPGLAIGKSDTSRCVVFYQRTHTPVTASPIRNVHALTGTSGGGVETSAWKRSNMQILSKPFQLRQDFVAILCIQMGPYPTVVLMTFQDSSSNIIGPALTTAVFGRAATGASSDVNHIGHVAYDATLDQFRMAVRAISYSNNPADIHGIEELVFSRDDEKIFQPVRFAERTYFSGGVIRQWDSWFSPEIGTIPIPELFGDDVTSGGSMADGTYSYVAVLSWIDDAGNLHESVPTDPVSVTISGGGGSGSVLLELAVHSVSMKSLDSNPQLAGYAVVRFYRTEAGGEIYYELPRPGSPANIVNDPTGNVLSYTDTTNDSSITSNKLLYTTGGVLENDHVYGGSTCLEEHKGRLWAASSEDRFRIYYSQEHNPGFPPSFNLAQYVDIPGERIVALGSLDDALIVYCERKIFAVVGDGPARTGDPATGTFTVLPVATSDGCRFQRSLIKTDRGHFFCSNQGFSKLDRSRQVTYIGGNVERTFGTFPYIVGGAFHLDRAELRWVGNNANSAASANQSCLYCFDLQTESWSTWFPTGTPKVFGSCVYNPNDRSIWYAGITGQLSKEDSSVTRDQSGASTYTSYPVQILTGWLSFGSTMLEKRLEKFRLALDRIGKAGGLNVLIRRDPRSASLSFSQTIPFTTDEIGALRTDGLAGHVNIQAGHKFQFWILEQATNSSTPGLGFAGMSFQLSAEGGLARQRSEETR